MITCIIVEDEIPAQKILQNFIGKVPHISLEGVFNSAIEANTFLRNTKVDVVFLDINLPDISGIDFIKTISNPPDVIITTAYPEYALSSFELDTIVDYLVKPFSLQRFLKAVNKLENRNRVETITEIKEAPSVFINVDKTHHKIVLDELLYIESDRNYITVVTQTQKLSYLESLKNWIEKLPEEQFVQVHKSFIVNRKKIDRISGNELFIDAHKIPIGRTFKQNLLRTLT